MICIETDRLVLRNVDPDDADIMFGYRNNEACAKFQRGVAKDMEGISALIAEHADDAISTDAPFIVAVALKRTDELVGEIMVMPNEGTISMGYTFSYRHHRKGYAFEALSALIGLLYRRFPEWDYICFVDPENIPSMRLLEKLGYRDLGYVPSKRSQVFGKWVNPETAAEIARYVSIAPIQ